MGEASGSFTGPAEPEGHFEEVGLVAEGRRTRLAIDQQDPVGSARREGEPAAVVERQVVSRGDFDGPVIQARLADRHLEPDQPALMPCDGHRLHDRRYAFQRERHADVSRREDAGIEDAGRDRHRLPVPQVGPLGLDVLHGEVPGEGTSHVDDRDVHSRREWFASRGAEAAARGPSIARPAGRAAAIRP